MPGRCGWLGIAAGNREQHHAGAGQDRGMNRLSHRLSRVLRLRGALYQVLVKAIFVVPISRLDTQARTSTSTVGGLPVIQQGPCQNILLRKNNKLYFFSASGRLFLLPYDDIPASTLH